jgi:GNAT superfamily N-acetyltransferase
MSAHIAHRRVGRAVTSVSRNGVRGTAARVGQWVVKPIARRLYLVEEHVWLVVPIVPEGRALPDGYVLRLGTGDDLEALAAIGGVSTAVGQSYLDRGAALYVAWRDDELAFSTWIHEGAVPVLAARGGLMPLPDRVVSFEDSIAAPAHRRSGIASAVIDEVTALQSRAGATAFITRIAVENAPALKWAESLGCRVVATVRLRRIGPWRRVRIEAAPGGEPMASMLAERL